jgi:hypothetical protein
MKHFTILLIAALFIQGCGEDEESATCTCVPNTTTYGIDTSIIPNIDTQTVIIGESDTLFLGESVQFQAPAGNWTSFVWTPSSGLSCSNCPNPIATPTFTTDYTLEVTDASGNLFSFTSLIRVLGDTLNPVIYVPTIFTPNGNGVNDRFAVYGTNFALFHLVVKDGGTVVFDTNDPGLSWDGVVNGAIPACSNFNYTVDVTFTNGETAHVEGEVTLFNSTCPEDLNFCRFGSQFDGVGYDHNLPIGEPINC